MAGLSSNWKQLQAQLKSQTTPNLKRHADSKEQRQTKKPRTTTAPKPAKLNPKKSHKMGGVQSAPPKEDRTYGKAPSLASWAADNGISAESLAEAYDLGSKDNSMITNAGKDKVNHGVTKGVEIGKYVAIDCEMVGVGPGGYESVLARASLVDFHGTQIYDSYVRPKERVTDWRTAISGISIKEMRFAREFSEVQQDVADILKGRILIGHDVKHDLTALMLSHPGKDIRDTSKHHSFKKLGNGRKPALRVLAQELLNVEIQSGAHSSIEDARVTMLLFRKHKSAFDVDNANRYAPAPSKMMTIKKSKKKRK
ncbi:hypothetical protein VHEMI10650 [[Torrubiella] hemipterigena]|uniref:RNA exonuclease 4 n=1 Tax=[Torrubiella] hemipterigena TaxID=1531966 RepID=A0A0A1TTL1_9HYPO|nr:hypothetical protein VHEMI10650 [[Torrubiella] hemipterigena]